MGYPARLVTRLALYTLVALITLAASPPAWSGGVLLREFGTPDVGLAGAGRGARAQDASTAFFNPAGMSELEQSELLGGFQPAIYDVEFERESGTTGTGGDGGNAGDFIPGLGGFGVYRFNEKWSAGLGLAAYFAGAIDYDNGWVGRYFVQKSELTTVAMSPVVAYRVNDWLSVGAGPVFLYGKLDQRSAVKNVLPDSEDGQVRLEAGDWGFGGQFALLVEPKPGTRVGVKYQLPVELEFTDTLSFRNLGPILETLVGGVDVDLDLTVPQFVDVSAYHELTQRWAIMATVSWEDHSEFGDTAVSVRSETTRQLTVSRNFEDTWGIAVGVQYRIADPWLASLGFGYDSSPVSKENRTPDLPLDRQIRVGAGVQWDWRENSTLGLAYEYVHMGDASLDAQGGAYWERRLVGRYDPNALHFIALSFTWRFGG